MTPPKGYSNIPVPNNKEMKTYELLDKVFQKSYGSSFCSHYPSLYLSMSF
jgi:hypothetical protein